MPKDSQHDHSLATELANIVGRPDFKTLSEKLTSFTPFRVLRVEQYEIRHTNTLAWLLDPEGSHGLKRAFLDRFLFNVLGAEAPVQTGFVDIHTELVLRADGALIEDNDEPDEESGSSRDRLDILIEGRRTDGTPWAVAIEAKINSQEGVEQLRRYDDALAKLFAPSEITKCYLTLGTATTVSSDKWKQIRWNEQVSNALRDALRDVRPSDRVHDFLNDYLELIHDLSPRQETATNDVIALANDPEVAPGLRLLNERVKEKRLMRNRNDDWARIYHRHKAAFDTCRNAVREKGAVLVWHVIDEILAESDGWELIDMPGNKAMRVRFAPKVWGKMHEIKPPGQPWNLFYHAEFRKTHGDIEIKLYVAPPGDPAMQKALMKKIFGPDLVLRPRDQLKPYLQYLRKFVWAESESVKLYTQSIGWEEQEDGTLLLTTPFDSVKKQFKEAVELHTKALLELCEASR
jgi:hypothetical protein